MTAKRWTLTDDGTRTHVDTLELSQRELGTAALDCTVEKRTLRGGLSEGVEIVEVDNGTCQFTILPTRGLSIWKACIETLPLGWNSPVRGPVHPDFVPQEEANGLGFLDGFDELLVRCGLLSNGAPEFDPRGHLQYPLHGRVSNRPAHRLEVSCDQETGEITIEGEVDDRRFHCWNLRLSSQLRTRPGERGFRIVDCITNLSARPICAQLLYHVNFGRPLLQEGSRVVIPFQRVVPRDARAAEDIATWDTYQRPQEAYSEQCYFCRLTADHQDMTHVMLRNAAGDRGLSMHWNIAQLPYFTLWKNTVAEEDGYVTGLEPATNFPNQRSFEETHGRVLQLPARGSAIFELRLEGHVDTTQVDRAAEQISSLQEGTKPEVLCKPHPEWCGTSSESD